MLETPGKDSELSLENFEKAVIMLTISIGDWIETEVLAESGKASDSTTPRKVELLLHATDHLRQYGAIGVHSAGITALSIACLWAQIKLRSGHIKETDLKSQMSWIMQSPATESAIRESFRILEESAKHEAENFIRGVESYVNTFVKCALNKFSCKIQGVNEDFLNKNCSDLKRLQDFFNGLDEGGHTYVAKVLEIVISTSMKNKLFKQDFDVGHSEYYSYTVELLNDILQLR